MSLKKQLAQLIVGAICIVSLSAATLPSPADDIRGVTGKQKAVFAGGCFWCTEAVFEGVKGVSSVVSGYSGGSPSDADYKKVSAGLTEHAEAIEITYDPAQVSYGQLLKVFFAVAHDPTQLNRQGPDYGKQYRSSIFYSSPEEKKIAEGYIKQLGAAGIFGKQIVTEVVPLKAFHRAEAYHQDFVRNNPTHGYVVVNALPKLKKLKSELPELARK